MPDMLLGIDIGTSSSKGVLAQPDGQIVATVERPHALSLPHPGWAEHDAEGIWWEDVLAICAELVPLAGGGLSGVCVSGIGPCCLLADNEGQPLRPAILYGIDTRAVREIEEQTSRFGADAILRRCGSALTTQAIGPKLAWLRRHEPEGWARGCRMFMASSYTVFKLTGEYVLDHHSASQCDPFYDLENSQWITEWAAEIAPGIMLPRLLWPAEMAGTVSKAGAAATGIPVGTPVAAGTVDAWAEALSANVREPGDTMLMYGTTMFLVDVLQTPSRHPAFWCTQGILPGTTTLAAGMATSGALTGWLRQIAGDIPYETLVREASTVPAGAEGLVALPYFAGERTPLFDPDARGMLFGLTLSHGRGHLYRALLEATAFGVRHIFDVLRETGAQGTRLVAVGGGTRGGLWTQIVSDVTGRQQEIPAVTIGASYGDALLAGLASGIVPATARWNRPTETVVPNPANRDIYHRLYMLYRELYPLTRVQAHMLASIQREGGPGGS